VGRARGTRALPGVAAAWGPLVEIRAGRPADLVGTVSHRPFSGLSVSWVVGRGGDGPWDTGPTGGGSGLGAAGGDSGREACWSGRDGVSPSVPWAIRSVGYPFRELSVP